MKTSKHISNTICKSFTILFYVLPTFCISQIDQVAKKTIENIFYGVPIKADFLSVYNSLTENQECFEIQPIKTEIINAKAKSSKTFVLPISNQAKPVYLTFNFDNKKLARRRIDLSEETSKENFSKIKTLLSAMASKTEEYSKTKESMFGESQPEDYVDFYDKTGSIFAQIEYKKAYGQQYANTMTLVVMFYDYKIK